MPASASARSTFERIERWRSSSETRPPSAGPAVGAAGGASGDAAITMRAAGAWPPPVAVAGASPARRSTVANASATVSGTAAGSRPFSLRLYFTAMAASISWTTATKVSMTPSPCDATAGNARRFQGLSVLLSSADDSRSGRSCLLYWRTRGSFSGTRRLASRLTFMFSYAATFSLRTDLRESATNTTASAPASTTRRVALYCTWPGTV